MSEEPAPRRPSSRLRALVPQTPRGRLVPALAALVVAVYAAEIGARALLDGRSTLGAVLALRHGGERAYPMVSAGTLLAPDESGHQRSAIHVDGQEVVPLGGIAGVTTVAGDDRRASPRFTSDERGFENPPGLWGEAPIEVLLVGDDLTLGVGVAPEGGLAAPVRAVFPRTVNLGAPGLGPLAELAELREYGPVLRPRVSVILFSEADDLRDLGREKNSLLVRYLERAFGQDLASRQDALDRALVQLEDARLGEADTLASRAGRVLGLGRLRELAGFGPAPFRMGDTPRPPDNAFYRQVLREAKRAVVAWEGQQLWLVYLPSWSRFAHPEELPALDRDRATVISTARGEGLSVLDAVSVLTAAGDPRECFAPPHGRQPPRYNERGYHVLGEALRDLLVVAGREKEDIGSLPFVGTPRPPRKPR